MSWPSRPSRLGVPPAADRAEHVKANGLGQSRSPSPEHGLRLLDATRFAIAGGAFGQVSVRRVVVRQEVEACREQERKARTAHTLGVRIRGGEFAIGRRPHIEGPIPEGSHLALSGQRYSRVSIAHASPPTQRTHVFDETLHLYRLSSLWPVVAMANPLRRPCVSRGHTPTVTP